MAPEAHGARGQHFEAALAESLERSRVWKRPIARSVQRLELPPGRDAQWVAEEYPRWLERFLPFFLRISYDGDTLGIALRPIERPMLELTQRRDAEGAGRYLLGVTGGLLAAEHPQDDPRLEFRLTLDGGHVLAALQDFEPRLPWWLYGWTQAIVHEGFMFAFRRYLADHGRRARRA